jgi:hypothetical protein
MIRSEALSGAHGIVLATNGLSKDEAKDFARIAIKEQMSRDQLERAIQESRQPKEPKATPTAKPAASVAAPPWFSDVKKEIASMNKEAGWRLSASFNQGSQQGELTIPFDVEALEDFEDATHQVVNALRHIRRSRKSNGAGPQ